MIKTEEQIHTPDEKTTEQTPETYSGSNMTQLLHIMAKPLLITAIFIIIAMLASEANYTVTLANLIMFAYIGWTLYAKHHKNQDEATIAGAVSGISIGFIVAVVRFITLHKFWNFFGLITQPIIWLIIGIGCTSLAWYISKKMHKTNKKQIGKEVKE